MIHNFGCLNFSMSGKYRRLSSSPADAKAVTHAYNRHIRNVFQDRSIITTMENMAEQAFRMDEVEVPHLICTIDAMDKSKWLVPRCLDSSKRLSALWRPALHVVGVLVAGVLEFFALLPPDDHGDSDTQQTLLSRALELAEWELRKRGKSMPWKVIFHSDNTPKEGRNSYMLQYAAALVSSERFAEASMALFAVGHTHNRLDQRFSVIGSLLSRAKNLETPQDYISHLQLNYKSARGVPVFIEEIEQAHHWRKFFAPLQTHFAGVTGSQSTSDAAHVFRVVRRDMVNLCAPEVDWHEEGFPHDPILLAKHWLHSKQLSQPPTTLWSQKWTLDFRTLDAAPRISLSDDSLKQYRKTAEQILAPPWQLQAAATYLLGWMQKNQASLPNTTLPDISFVVEGREFLPTAVCAGATWKDFAPNGAVAVQPVRKSKTVDVEKKRKSEQMVPQGAVVPRRARAVMNVRAEQRTVPSQGSRKRPAAAKAVLKRPAAARS